MHDPTHRSSGLETSNVSNNSNDFDTEKPVVEFQEVDFAYDTQLILQNVSFNIHAGEYISVIGPNGGGKTTLIRLLLGLLQPSHGHVRLFGSAPNVHRNRVGYVPQYQAFDSRFPITVREVVLMGRIRRPIRFYRNIDKEEANRALAMVEMDNIAETSFSELSGGQRQRTLIARAIASNPDLLIMDEPTTNIDARGGKRFADLMRSLGARRSVMIITHDLDMVYAQTERVLCINRTVHLHPVQDLEKDTLQNLYGHHVRIVRHDINIQPQMENTTQ